MAQLCRLCEINPPIRNSHIMPGFGYRRYAADLAHGGRFIELLTMSEHNRQLKRPWFCTDCEKQFGESYAASFIDQIEANRYDSKYDGDLLRFATAFSWRACLFDIAEGGQGERKLKILTPALTEWRAYLLGNAPSVPTYTQHAFVLEPNSPPDDGRMGMEVSYQDDLIITQIGPLVCFGVIKPKPGNRQHEWALGRSKISRSGGEVVVLSKTEINYALTDSMMYLLDRAGIWCNLKEKDFHARKAIRIRR